MMVARLLCLQEIPEPADAADALAIAICDLHTQATLTRQRAGRVSDRIVALDLTNTGRALASAVPFIHALNVEGFSRSALPARFAQLGDETCSPVTDFLHALVETRCNLFVTKCVNCTEPAISKPPSDRTSFGSSAYFITASSAGRRSVFQTERMARLFIDAVYFYRREHKFLVHRFVVMHDHFHLLLSPLDMASSTRCAIHKGRILVPREKRIGREF